MTMPDIFIHLGHGLIAIDAGRDMDNDIPYIRFAELKNAFGIGEDLLDKEGVIRMTAPKVYISFHNEESLDVLQSAIDVCRKQFKEKQ